MAHDLTTGKKIFQIQHSVATTNALTKISAICRLFNSELATYQTFFCGALLNFVSSLVLIIAKNKTIITRITRHKKIKMRHKIDVR